MSHGIESPADLDPLLERADVIAFGPGLGQGDWAESLFARIAGDTRPQVWDADALNLLARVPGTQAARVITPHPGEAARLLGIDVTSVQADRPGAAAALVERFGGVAVLKGAGTIVAGGQGVPSLCASGNPGMATAGMGDVLTGIIAALLGQGLAPEKAAELAVEAHARAGDWAARNGERGLIASDLFAELRIVLNP